MPTTTNPTSRYSTPSVVLHWLMLLAFIGVYAAMNLKGLVPRGSDSRELLRTAHYSLGLTIFALVWLRIVFRLFGSTPAIVPQPPAWQEKLAKLGHLALYALMVLMPLIGWSLLSARGKPIPYFGLSVPPLLGENTELGHTLKQLHELGANIGYFLIGGHAAAALYHHYFVKDNTLLRMRLR